MLNHENTAEFSFVYEDLEESSAEQNGQEVKVVEKVLEDVKVLGPDLSAVDLIENLKENESIVDIGQALSFVFCIFLHFIR